MRVFWAVARREVLEWRLALAVGAVLGLMPIVGPLLPMARHHPVSDVRTAILVVLGGTFTAVLAVILGAGLLSRDLREGRLSFFYARPIPGPTLWLGKLTGGALVIVLAVGLVALPSLLADSGEISARFASRFFDGGERLLFAQGNSWPLFAADETERLLFFERGALPRPLGLLPSLGTWVGTLFLVLAAVHAAAVFIRARNAWLLADLVGSGLVVGLGMTAVERLVGTQALRPLVWAERGCFVWALVSFLVAGAVQIHVGRSDEPRSRRLLTAILWPLLLLGALAFNAYALYAVSATSRDLVSSGKAASGQVSELLAAGDGVLISGRTPAGYDVSFWVDPRNEKEFEVGPPFVVRRALVAGKTLFWNRCRELWPPDCEIFAADLSRPEDGPRALEIPLSLSIQQQHLVVHGRYLAVTERLWRQSEVRLYDLAAGKLLTALRRPNVFEAAFGHDGRLYVYSWITESRFDAVALDPRDASLAPRHVGSLSLSYGVAFLVHHPVSGLVLVFRVIPSEVQVFSAASEEEEPVGVYPLQWRTAVFGGEISRIRGLRLTSGGETVIVSFDFHRQIYQLNVLSPTGDLVHQVPLDAVPTLGGETAPGRILVGQQRDDQERAEGFSTWELDLVSGELVERRQGALPLPVLGDGPAPASPYLLAENGDLLLWNRRTDKVSVVREGLR